MSQSGLPKRSWVRRDREKDSYCRICKTWKPKAEFDYRDVERGLLHFECRECRQNMRSWVRRDRENESYCRTCKTWKPKNEFNYRDVNRCLLQYDCRECQQGHRRNSYANHRETTRASNDEWTRNAVDTANDYFYHYFFAHPCIDCGCTNILTLTFDHVRGKKHLNVSEMVSKGRSIETIKEEIRKCEVVCFNCHMRREHKKRVSL
jgi:hypothetical protein